MSWTRRLRGWLRGEGKADASSTRRDARGTGVERAADPSSRRGPRRAPRGTASLDDPELEAFAATRRGVEAYLEPRTPVYPVTLLLVADDGEYLRRPVGDATAARAWCAARSMPLYDAARVGYPRRIRDYDKGVRRAPIDLGDMPPWPTDEVTPDDADTTEGTED